MRYAIIENDIVVNIAISNNKIAANWIAIPTGCPVGIGDSYNDGCFYDVEGNMRKTPELDVAMKMIEELEAKNAALSEENQVLQEQSNMLMDCLLEMSELVYA